MVWLAAISISVTTTKQRLPWRIPRRESRVALNQPPDPCSSAGGSHGHSRGDEQMHSAGRFTVTFPGDGTKLLENDHKCHIPIARDGY